MALLAALQELAHKQIKSVENLDADAMIALRLPDCVQVFSPASMGFPEPMNNEEWATLTCLHARSQFHSLAPLFF